MVLEHDDTLAESSFDTSRYSQIHHNTTPDGSEEFWQMRIEHMLRDVFDSISYIEFTVLQRSQSTDLLFSMRVVQSSMVTSQGLYYYGQHKY